ncbi:SLC13 family permease [Candidatus Palauibacter sp.]|uniref:SLC13 family permease n=1 Tax=Candidatus Palauibacter sp. TaxID=3101350 RepID=UPI003B017494
MNLEVFIVGGILAVAVVLFVTEKIRVDLVALMVMLGLVVTGILEGEQAIMGFANEAVITIASVLILSGALARTGVARLIGQRVLAASGDGVGRLTAVMMATVGLLSGIMNDIGITALMLPVVLDMARRTGTPPSKLLMPLAFGSLLGGMTTLIGTAPNILVNGALRDAGFEPFGMFSFTPVGLTALAAGIVYMTFLGRQLFPNRDPKKESTPADLGGLYDLGGLIGMLKAPHDSTLAGKTLQQSRLGQALGLNVVAVQRSGQMILAPGTDFVLSAGDEMVVEGTLERFEALRAWKQLEIESRDRTLGRIADASIEVAELELAEDSPLIGQTVRKANLRRTRRLHVLAILRGDRVHRTGLRLVTLAPGDRLLVAARSGRLAALEEDKTFGAIHSVPANELIARYQMERRIQSVRISEESLLAGQLLAETRLADAFGLTVVGILRADEELLMPDPDTRLEGGDVLLLRGRFEDLEILEGLQGLTVGDNRPLDFSRLESDTVGLAEASLSPRTTFAGKTIQELNFRENYGVSILAIWRNGEIYRSGLRRMELLPGDAFLLYGDRNKLARLVEHRDFLVMTEGAAEVVRSRKAPVSALIMAGVLTSVVSGLLPIFIAAPIGAVLMVLTGCLNIEEAYRCIELKAVVLIAGMLSLGMAMQESGTAALVAEAVLGSLADFGPLAVVAGLFLITALSAQMMPTAAVAVLMSPIALSTAVSEGLSPQALMMTVAVASSCAFMSPVGHPVNLLVMGFGGYRFVDFIKAGFPLLILVMAVVLTVLPLVWPLVPAG